MNNGNQQYEQEHQQYLYKEAYMILRELNYKGSEDNFDKDLPDIITELNKRMGK